MNTNNCFIIFHEKNIVNDITICIVKYFQNCIRKLNFIFLNNKTIVGFKNLDVKCCKKNVAKNHFIICHWKSVL